MSKPIKDGGPAFPLSEPGGEYCGNTLHLGMTLRDWFAGQALTGMLAVEPCDAPSGDFAKCAYDMADAMIAQRTKEKV